MPLSTSTLFADRTMLRSIFMALEDMALFSDACLLYSAPDFTSMIVMPFSSGMTKSGSSLLFLS